MLICIVKTRKFQTPCHFLIGFTCLADGLHVIGQFVFCWQLFGGYTSTQTNCFLMLLPAILGYTISGPLILGLGLDRLIAVKYPQFYSTLHKHPIAYIFIQLICPLIYSTLFLAYGYWSTVDATVLCSNPVALNAPVFQIFTYSSALIYLIVIIIYLKVYLILKAHKNSSSNIFRSIAVTVGIVVGGWAVTTVANIVSYLFPGENFELFQVYAGVAVNFAVSANILVFYAINLDYRLAIRQLLGLKMPCVIDQQNVPSIRTI
ncbi:unnamed protein product [Caenorhabditis angaria]|uniref:G-protein coupled receptors family 1 profile domain-containing protein n=1 Tax=Caenorhabditis angaria TaxID=860376 RepID=A0A9P1N4Z0_9PELO|nr:unnamed protein product [Caenorhabditis angaria]